MKARYLLDTSAILAHLLQENGFEVVERCLSCDQGPAAVSIISWVEFQFFLGCSDYSKTDTGKIIKCYEDVLGMPLPIDKAVGQTALDLRAQAKFRIHLTDLLIAACAKTHGLKLVYRDRHIEGIPEKALLQLKLSAK